MDKHTPEWQWSGRFESYTCTHCLPSQEMQMIGGPLSPGRPMSAWTGSEKSMLSLNFWQLIHYKHEFKFFTWFNDPSSSFHETVKILLTLCLEKCLQKIVWSLFFCLFCATGLLFGNSFLWTSSKTQFSARCTICNFGDSIDCNTGNYTSACFGWMHFILSVMKSCWGCPFVVSLALC